MKPTKNTVSAGSSHQRARPAVPAAPESGVWLARRAPHDERASTPETPNDVPRDADVVFHPTGSPQSCQSCGAYRDRMCALLYPHVCDPMGPRGS